MIGTMSGRAIRIVLSSITSGLIMSFSVSGNTGTQDLTEPFTVSVEGADVQPAEVGIRLRIEITNNGDGDFELSVRQGMPPYGIIVFNEKGAVLESVELRQNLAKNRHQRNVPLLFKAHEKKVYEALFSRYVDETGQERPVPAGVYSLYVRLRVLSPSQEAQPRGYLQAKTVKSKAITVNLR
ncbi:MAG TPA: hypothetical protein VN345_16300 [Blastocatellia bacterium]|jgi:hypothetical protein|nr:hypothetical protein [Blastocatellia bacterium]